MDTSRARYAGERALESLREARDCLSSARTWGIFDILGGHGLSGLLKHAKLAQAQRILDDARRDLEEYRRELSFIPAVDIEVSSFLAFADFFFDGLLADIMVQSRITKALEQSEDAIRKVEESLSKL